MTTDYLLLTTYYLLLTSYHSLLTTYYLLLTTYYLLLTPYSLLLTTNYLLGGGGALLGVLYVRHRNEERTRRRDAVLSHLREPDFEDKAKLKKAFHVFDLDRSSKACKAQQYSPYFSVCRRGRGTYYLLLTAYCLLLTTYYLLPTTHYSLLTTCYLLLCLAWRGVVACPSVRPLLLNT